MPTATFIIAATPGPWGLAAIALLLVVLLFTLTWALSIRLDNYSLVDVTWSYSLAIIAPLYALLGPGHSTRRIIAAAIAMAWSLRLGTYLLRRIARHHPHEDARYIVLRAKWQHSLRRNFFGFFQAQAVLILLLSAPIWIACQNTAPTLSAIEISGLLLWLIGILGEALADAQMQAFKGNASNRGKVCQSGLWSWSRHPNYFFESIVWCGFYLFACGSPWGWATLYAPALILYFLLRVTGIPLTEQCAIQSKGEAYRAYQRSTSAFIPWPPKP